jgi:periplasmic protein TonB
MYGSPRRSTLLSGLLHAAAIAVIVVATRVESPPPAYVRTSILTGRELTKYLPAPHRPMEGGGGGGRDSTPASRGDLPKFKPRQFTPPTAVVRNVNPILAMEPTLVGDVHIEVPTLNLGQFGDPNGVAGPPSNGRGKNGGIGDGDGGGVGNHHGPGYGEGDDGGISGGGPIVAGATAPIVLYKIEPEYSDEARKARLQGTVVLRIEVDTNGKARNVSVRQSLGLGLDERAIEAVKKWRFQPGSLNGKAVVTVAWIDVTFRLL